MTCEFGDVDERCSWQVDGSVELWGCSWISGDDLLASPATSKEVGQELKAQWVVLLQRSAGAKNPQLGALRSQSKPKEQEFQEIGNLSAGGPSIEVDLINDEVKNTALFFQPLPSPFENVLVGVAHEHDAEHAEVGNEDVRGCILHVPPGSHLRSVQSRKEIANVFIAALP